MASLTKVLVTTTAIMTFYQRGELNLSTFFKTNLFFINLLLNNRYETN